MELFVVILSFLYAATGIISLWGYLPTIKDLLNKKDSANTESYLIWTLTYVITFLYVIVVVPNLLLETMIGLNLLACLVIYILDLRLKRKKK